MWWFSNVVNESARVVTIDGVTYKDPAIKKKRRGDALVHIDGVDVRFEDAGHIAGGPHHHAVRISIPAISDSHSKLWWHDGSGEMVVKLHKDKKLVHIMGCGNETWIEYETERTPIPRTPSEDMVPVDSIEMEEGVDFVYVCCAKNNLHDVRNQLLGRLTRIGWDKPFWIQALAQEHASSMKDFVAAAADHAKRCFVVLVYLTQTLLNNPVCMGILEKLASRERSKLIVVSTAEHMYACQRKLTEDLKRYNVHVLQGTNCDTDEKELHAIYNKAAAKYRILHDHAERIKRENMIRQLVEEKGARYNKKIAVVVGVGAYVMLEPRPSVTKDCLAMRSALVSIGFDQVRNLSNFEATKTNILSTIEKISQNLTADDLLVMVFMGRGSDTAFYPIDGAPRKSASNLETDDFRVILKSIASRHVLMLCDGFKLSAFERPASSALNIRPELYRRASGASQRQSCGEESQAENEGGDRADAPNTANNEKEDENEQKEAVTEETNERGEEEESSLEEIMVQNLRKKSRMIISRDQFNDANRDSRKVSDFVSAFTQEVKSEEFGTHALIRRLQDLFGLGLLDGVISVGQLPGHSGADNYLRL